MYYYIDLRLSGSTIRGHRLRQASGLKTNVEEIQVRDDDDDMCETTLATECVLLSNATKRPRGMTTQDHNKDQTTDKNATDHATEISDQNVAQDGHERGHQIRDTRGDTRLEKEGKRERQRRRTPRKKDSNSSLRITTEHDDRETRATT
jgi:hypothetical protein